MSFEAYSVAIRLNLVENVTSGLIGLATQFRTLNTHIRSSTAELTALEARLNGIKRMGLIGGAAAAVGGGMLALLSAPVKAAREYELAFTKFKTLNLGDAVNAQADKFARSANLMGVSATQLMRTMAESVGLFGSFSEAQKFAPQIAKLNVANSAIYGDRLGGGIDEGATRAIMKFIDRRGGTRDDATFARNLDLAEKIVAGSGGFIKFSDLATFSQQGGTAFRSLSDQGLLNYSALIQEQGGARAGTALMSIYQNLVAGRTPVKTMHFLESLGLGTVAQQISGTVGGKRSTSNVFNLDPRYAAMLQSDPVGFFSTVFPQILAAKGITSQADVLRATNLALSNRTASGQASIADTQLFQVARDAGLARNAFGAAAVEKQFANDPNSKYINLSSSYTNLMNELGRAAWPIVSKLIKGLIVIFNGLTKFAQNFPTTTNVLVTAFASLAALTVAGGTIQLIRAGFAGLGLVLNAGLAANILSFANATKALTLQLAGAGIGKIAAVGAAGYGGYKVGQWLNSLGPNGDLGGYLGGRIFETFNSYDPNANTKSKSTVVQVNLDGKRIATVVSKHQGEAANGPQTGVNGFDSILSPMPAGGLGY